MTLRGHSPQADPSGLSTDGTVPLAMLEKSTAALQLLLQGFDGTAGRAERSPSSCEQHPVRAVEAARTLFLAIRHKHAPTAAHSLRVALGSSAWGLAAGLHGAARRDLEIAALLHDIGKLGAPDRLLLRPGALASDDAKLMDEYRLSGLEILADCLASRQVMETVRHSSAWYDGSRSNYPLVAEEIPVGARMLAIVDAFDSMTSDQVYRRAMSRERALGELFSYAGTQFDPELVKRFGELQIAVEAFPPEPDHWLRLLDAQSPNRPWARMNNVAENEMAPTGLLFQQKLLDNMHDAVVFVDCHMRIIQWNRGAERLTGIAASSVVERTWSPALIGMRDDASGRPIDAECPVTYCVSSGVQSLRRLLVISRSNRPIAVDVHTVPVVASDGTICGATMLLHDASSETSLEERCQNLHERATKDPLTRVANRAEFDRTHQLFVKAHLEHQLPCSMIMCDIDRFKSINDTYGHQAGDEVLRFIGGMLARDCRTGDLVARYGGEEFVLLCADCNNATAAGRAEHLRKSFSEIPQPALNNNVVTASFGVTEIQPGDSPASMLRRADRALLEAKRLGRNRVVQLGGGLGDFCEADDQGVPATDGDLFLERVLVTAVPLQLTFEKLRGFVLDHNAEIVSIKNDRVELHIDAEAMRSGRRRSDRTLGFTVELHLTEQRVPTPTSEGRAPGALRARDCASTSD